MPLHLLPADVLLIIDMQNDFLPGGALPVAEGDQIIPDLNAVADLFDHVILTQDWHPAGHISFAATHGRQPFTDVVQASYGPQTLWPDHCLQGTRGAALHAALDIPHAELILRKGFRKEIDSYSAFLENDGSTPTGLAAYLRERGFQRVFSSGVAFDFCVGSSAIAAARLGFVSILLEDLTRPVRLPGSVESTRRTLAEAGVKTMQSSEITSAPSSK